MLLLAKFILRHFAANVLLITSINDKGKAQLIKRIALIQENNIWFLLDSAFIRSMFQLSFLDSCFVKIAVLSSDKSTVF